MFPLPNYRYRILSNPDLQVKTNAKIQNPKKKEKEKKVQITNFKAKKGNK